MKDKDNALHLAAIKNIDNCYSATQTQRMQSNEDRRFATIEGAQWEGSTAAGYSMDRFEDYPRYELNKVAKECDRIISEYRRNRIEVRFKPTDTQGSKELAAKLNDAFRSDWKYSDGKAAIDNAFQDIVLGGYGGVRLKAVWEDEYNPLNEDKKIVFETIHDPDTSLFFDLDAKKYDKSDAWWAAEVFTIPLRSSKRNTQSVRYLMLAHTMSKRSLTGLHLTLSALPVTTKSG